MLLLYNKHTPIVAFHRPRFRAILNVHDLTNCFDSRIIECNKTKEYTYTCYKCLSFFFSEFNIMIKAFFYGVMVYPMFHLVLFFVWLVFFFVIYITPLCHLNKRKKLTENSLYRSSTKNNI